MRTVLALLLYMAQQNMALERKCTSLPKWVTSGLPSEVCKAVFFIVLLDKLLKRSTEKLICTELNKLGGQKERNFKNTLFLKLFDS